ncbi:Hypothetical predicted protein [Octopus vulgaris]|uniref:Uncharacterized protein n=1 Tax=Octopus vulgaris TaxID=6645 RepID=A0AA36ARS0_OCTVU|nr:Hypothetical predicted protein [Octopus vulgaris]
MRLSIVFLLVLVTAYCKFDPCEGFDVQQTLTKIKGILENGLGNKLEKFFKLKLLLFPESGKFEIDGTPLVITFYADNCEAKIVGKRSPSKSYSEIIGKRSPSKSYSEIIGKRSPSKSYSEIIGKRSPSKSYSEIVGKRSPSKSYSEIIGKRSPSKSYSEIIGKRSPSKSYSEIIGKRSPSKSYSEIIGKRSPSKSYSEIIGKRSPSESYSEIIGKRSPFEVRCPADVTEITTLTRRHCVKSSPKSAVLCATKLVLEEIQKNIETGKIHGV